MISHRPVPLPRKPDRVLSPLLREALREQRERLAWARVRSRRTGTGWPTTKEH